MSKINLMFGDCLELMKDIPDKSINLTMAEIMERYGELLTTEQLKTIKNYAK